MDILSLSEDYYINIYGHCILYISTISTHNYQRDDTQILFVMYRQ